MNFSEALIELKNGNKIKRKNWNKNEFIHIKDKEVFNDNKSHMNEIFFHHILADDWEVAEDSDYIKAHDIIDKTREQLKSLGFYIDKLYLIR